MDLIVIAQIITGTATLIVALVLVYQLRQQHRDSDRELSLDSLDLVQKFRINELVSEDFPELFYKSRINGFSNLNDYEKYRIYSWLSANLQRIITEWRLGRLGNTEVYFKGNFRQFFENKSALELYKDNSYARSFREALISTEKNPLQKKGLRKLSDEVYEEISGEKIVN